MKNLSPKAPTYTAVVLIALGLLTIFFAWNGAASIADTRAQFPYLISGGLGGVALVGAGLVLVRTFEGRRDTQTLVGELRRLTAAVERMEKTQAAALAHERGEELHEPAMASAGAVPPAPDYEASH